MSKKSIGLKRRVYRKANVVIKREMQRVLKKDNYKDICINKNIRSIKVLAIPSYTDIGLGHDEYVLGEYKTIVYEDKDGNIIIRSLEIEYYQDQILRLALYKYNKFKHKGISYNTMLNNIIECTIIHEFRHLHQYMYDTFDISCSNDCAE